MCNPYCKVEIMLGNSTGRSNYCSEATVQIYKTLIETSTVQAYLRQRLCCLSLLPPASAQDATLPWE